jgi:Las17-binding protein actin regulator
LSYSRSHGQFAGIDLEGSWIRHDKDSTVALYGKDYTPTELLTGKVTPPEAAHGFLAEVRRAEMREPAKQKSQSTGLAAGTACSSGLHDSTLRRLSCFWGGSAGPRELKAKMDGLRLRIIVTIITANTSNQIF